MPAKELILSQGEVGCIALALRQRRDNFRSSADACRNKKPDGMVANYQTMVRLFEEQAQESDSMLGLLEMLIEGEAELIVRVKE